MSTQLQTESKATESRAVLPATAGLLQRKCACGGHTTGGGECAECAKRKNKLQRKLSVGANNDSLEQEADRVAEQVMASSNHSKASRSFPRLQRYTGQTTDGAETAPASVDQVLAGAGKPLESAMRQDMEARFGRDFSAVRVHTGYAAEQSAREVRAHAYTVGQDIVFGASRFEPSSADGRRLIAHELAHVVQQSTGLATPRIQRRDWGILGGTCCNRSPDGDEWALVDGGVWQRLSSGQCTGTTTDCDGVTCGGGFYYVSNFETGTCRTPRRDDATFRPRRWTPDRSEPDARSPVQRGSTGGDTPPGYQYDREPFVIEHRSGSRHEVPGLYQSEAEFGASGATSSLTAPSQRRAGRPVTGGFTEDLAVDTGFATGVDQTTTQEVAALVRSAGDRVDRRLVPAMQAVANDRFVFRALQTFLERDHGRLVAWDNDSGRYVGDALPPVINVGIAGGPLDTRTTLVHELLHYVFDKADTVLGEAVDTGGADHPAIAAIESRYLIIDLIRSGRPPLHDKIRSSFGQFLQNRDFFPILETAIARNDRAAMRAAVEDPAFVRTTVSSGLLSEASSRAFPPSADDYRYTAEQFRDLAFIWAQNAVIVRHAMTTAVDVSTRSGTPLRDVFSRADWRSEMASFMGRFVGALRRDRRRGVVTTASRP